MKICLTKCIESSPYSINTVTEDHRLSIVHALLANVSDLRLHIDDHRLLEMDSAQCLKEHLESVASDRYDVMVVFIKQVSANIDFSRRWLKFFMQKTKGTKRPKIFIAGDVGVGYSVFFEENLIDGVFYGNDTSISANIQRLQQSSDLSDLSDIIFEKNGQLVKKGVPSFLENAEQSIHGTLYAYDSEIVRNNCRKYIPILKVTRGCYANCNFCHESASDLKGIERHVHYPVSWFEKELERYAQLGVKEILFNDSNFLQSKKSGNEWLEGFVDLMSSTYKDIEYSFWTRASDLDETRMKLLSKTQLKSILIGVESLQDKRLKKLNKGEKRTDMLNAVHLMNEYGIEGKLSFILFQPDMSFEELETELVEIKALFEAYPRVQRNPLFSYNLMMPHPDTPLYNEYVEKGYLSKKPEYLFEEHFTYMSGRRVGSHDFVPNFADHHLALVCELFRIHNYEYSRKWHKILRQQKYSEKNYSMFFHRLPMRLIDNMISIVEVVKEGRALGLDLKKIQVKGIDCIYERVLAHYRSTLDRENGKLETTNTTNYTKRWSHIVELKLLGA